jgi:DNA-binding MarR family transcriptional regulator
MEKMAQPAPADAELAAALEDFLLGIYGLTNAFAESQALQANGIEIDDWAVLSSISPGIEQPLSQISRRAGVPRARVRDVIDRLVNRSLVLLRQTTQADGKRERMISIAPEGEKLRQQVLAGLSEFLAAISERAQTPEALARVARRVGSASRVAKVGLKAFRPRRTGSNMWTLEEKQELQ